MITKNNLFLWIVGLTMLALLPLLPEPIGSKYHGDLVTKIMILSIFALSLQLLVGFTGLVSLGHAAFLGFAAYMVATFSPESEAGNGWLLMAICIGGAGLLALLIGLLVMRSYGVYFIMVTLAFGQLVYFVFHDIKIFGGSDGTYIYFKPDFSIMQWQPFDLESGNTFYWFTLVLLIITVIILQLILRSRLGHAFVGIKHNQLRMRAAGFESTAYKIASFVISGMLAGLAGFLYACQYGYVNPELLSWHQSGNVLLMIILGGLGSLGGAIIGAFAFVLLSEWFTALTKHWQLLLGGFIIFVVMLMPYGLAGLPRQLREWRVRSANKGGTTR